MTAPKRIQMTEQNEWCGEGSAHGSHLWWFDGAGIELRCGGRSGEVQAGPDGPRQMGAKVLARMDELGIGLSDLERMSGVSRETIRPLIEGTRPSFRRTSLTKISQALWGRGDMLVDASDRRQLIPVTKG